MDSLLQSDIFFFVSSIGFLVIAGLLVSILLYVIKIIKIVVEVVETVKNITKGVSEKIEDIGQVTQSPLFMQIASFFMRKKRKTKPRADPE